MTRIVFLLSLLAGCASEVVDGQTVALSDGGTEAGDGATGDGYYCTSESVLECASDADCEPGFECEVEHCSSFCKPHGGDDGDDDRGGDRGGDGSDDPPGDDRGGDRGGHGGHGGDDRGGDDHGGPGRR